MPSIMCVPITIGRVYFEASDVMKDPVPYMVKAELTNIPVQCLNVYSHPNCPETLFHLKKFRNIYKDIQEPLS